jgi:hypothetical protein
MDIEFLVSNQHGEFFVRYKYEMKEGKENLIVNREKLSYHENQHGKKYKSIVSKEQDQVVVRTKEIRSLDQWMQPYLNEVEIQLIKNLKIDFDKDFLVITDSQNGLILASIMMPFSVHLPDVRGQIPYGLNEPMVLPIELYGTLKKVVNQTNGVLGTIIPNLRIEINEIHTEKIENIYNDTNKAGTILQQGPIHYTVQQMFHYYLNIS